MKKIMNIFVLVAAAAMTLVSCQKNEMDAPAAKKELHFTIKANAPQTKTVISDNGEGFHKKDIPHLFDRFYRGSNAVKESAGIGLNLSRMIIAKQNGTIIASNQPNGGAQFTIRFYKGAV